MVAMHLHDQVVEIQKIAMIAGKQNPIILDGVSQMDCIIFSQKTHPPEFALHAPLDEVNEPKVERRNHRRGKSS
jgi:hypothetical protein